MRRVHDEGGRRGQCSQLKELRGGGRKVSKLFHVSEVARSQTAGVVNGELSVWCCFRVKCRANAALFLQQHTWLKSNEVPLQGGWVDV